MRQIRIAIVVRQQLVVGQVEQLFVEVKCHLLKQGVSIRVLVIDHRVTDDAGMRRRARGSGAPGEITQRRVEACLSSNKAIGRRVFQA
jgi:hypothetical protein